MKRLSYALGGAGLGPMLMYLFDPRMGRRRRARLRDRTISAAREAADAADTTQRDVKNRVLGRIAARLGGVIGTLGALGGAGLLLRGATNLELRRLIGVRAGRRAVDVQKTITIDAPVAEVYAFWSAYENFPRFISHVREVRPTGDGRAHWVVAGPGGVPVEWDTEVTERVPNQLIAWRTVPGAAVEHAGLVRFQPDGGGTRVHVRMSYNPPLGAIGHTVAAILGADPKRTMDEDLLRFKSLLETGRTSAHGERVRRDDIAG